MALYMHVRFNFRLHRITAYCYRCAQRLSVSLIVSLFDTRLISASLCKNGRTDQDALWGEHSWRPTGHCVTWGPDPPQTGGGDLPLKRLEILQTYRGRRALIITMHK